MPGRKGRKTTLAFIQTLVDVGVPILKEQGGLSHAESEHCIIELASSLCDLFARCTLYVPLNSEVALWRRDMEIDRLARDGIPVLDIALKHQLTIQHVYAILKYVRSRDDGLTTSQRMARQGVLPGLGSEDETEAASESSIGPE